MTCSYSHGVIQSSSQCNIHPGRLNNESRTSSSTSALPDVNKVQEPPVEHEPTTAVDVSQVCYHLPVASFQYVAIACTSAHKNYIEDLDCNSDFMNIIHGFCIIAF